MSLFRNFFWSSNTGYLFLNWPNFGSDHKKSKKSHIFGTFFDHQIQVIYSWTGQILVPKQVRWTFPKIAFANRFGRKKVKCPLREAAGVRTNPWRTWNIGVLLHNRSYGQKDPKWQTHPKSCTSEVTTVGMTFWHLSSTRTQPSSNII